MAEAYKFAFRLVGVAVAMLAIFLFVGFSLSYALIFMNFTGPESVVEPCFEIGFGCGLACSVIAGILAGRHFWRQYSASKPD